MRRSAQDLLSFQLRLLWLRWIYLSLAIRALEQIDVRRHRTIHALRIPSAK